jgi:hypothetical protein
MSFKINFTPQEPIHRPGGITSQLMNVGVLNADPMFAKHLRYMTLLCTQSNQISGLGSEAGEQDVASRGPTSKDFYIQCNNLSTT